MGGNLEEMMEEVGSFGCFQFLLIPLTKSMIIVAVWSMMFMVFGSVQPDWWCQSSDLLANQSAFPILNYSSGQVMGENITKGFGSELGDMESRNQSDGVEGLARCEALRANDGVCDRIVFAPGMDTIVTEFQLVCDLSWVPSLTISVQMVGVLVGAVLAGQLADSVGRKTTMMSFTALHAVFNFIAAFSVSWHMFAVLRTLMGVTIGALLVLTFSYPTEFIGMNRRAVIASLPVWGVGTLTLCGLVWAVPHWSHLHLITAACSFLSLPGFAFLPESVRWLMVKDRASQAHDVLARMAKWNKRQAPSLSSVQALCSDTDQVRRKYSYFHLFSTRRMMKTSCLTGFMWFACSVSYYGISFGIKNLSGDFNLNFLLMTLVELPTSPFVFHLTAWLGRRWTNFGSFLVCALSTFALVPVCLLMPEEETGNIINALCIVCRGSILLGWATLTLCTAELFPTVVRNIGMGFCGMSARLGGILAPYILSVKEPYVFYSIIGTVMALTALAPLFLAETRGQPLPDELFIPTNQKKTTTVETEQANGGEMSALNS